MKIRFAFILLCLAGLSACGIIQRSERSGYANGDTNQITTAESFYQERYLKNYREATSQLAIAPDRELTEPEAAIVLARMQLNKLEKKLVSSQEKKQYYALKPYFRSDWERVYFLRLPDVDSRARWARNKGISTDESNLDSFTQQLIENSDIQKGMTRNIVKQSWGEPDSMEVAGDPLYGNERWVYRKQVSNENGYVFETRRIYFESGRVVGWETQTHD